MANAISATGPRGFAAKLNRSIGVRYKPDLAAVLDYEQWLGRSMEFVVLFLHGSSNTWEERLRQAAYQIRMHDGAPYGFIVSVPLQERKDHVAEAANGTYDDWLRKIAAVYIDNGRADSIIRLGWEFNGDFMAWSARPDPKGWVRSYRHMVEVFRSVPGAAFSFDWNISSGGGWTPELAYPGDDVVDFITMDFYDRTFKELWSDPKKRWARQVGLGDQWVIGLERLAELGRQHGKPLGVPEWGLTDNHVDETDPDNVYLVEQFHQWIQAHDVAYTAYFEEKTSSMDHRLRGPLYPKASARYRALWSAGFEVDPEPEPEPEETDYLIRVEGVSGPVALDYVQGGLNIAARGTGLVTEVDQVEQEG